MAGGNRPWLLGAGLAWVLASISLAYGQVRSYRYTHKPVEHSVELSPKGRLEIQISERDGGWWVVGVHARGPGKTAQLTATWVKSRPSARGLGRIPEEFFESGVAFSPGWVYVGLQPAPNRDLVIWCSVPAGTHLVVNEWLNQAFAGRITEDLILINGIVEARPAPYPQSSFFALARVRGPAPTTGKLRKLGDRTIADWAALKQNALRLERPELDPQPGAGAGGGVPAAVFTLEILVGEEGKVREVKYAGGQEPDFMGRIAESVRRWEFRPFLFDGKPTEVSARIPFTVTRSGQVLSPVF